MDGLKINFLAKGYEVGLFSKQEVYFPKELSPDAQSMLIDFIQKLALKMQAADRKYGYGDSWMDPICVDGMRKDLISHLFKGDPKDVALYCAFMHYHGQPTYIQENAT